MHPIRHIRWAAAAVLAFAAAAPLRAQDVALARADTGGTSSATQGDERPHGLVTREELIVDRLRKLGIPNPDPAPRKPKDHADSVAWLRHRRAADALTGRKIVVSIYDRRLWLIDGTDTLLTTEVGVGMGSVTTPRGRVYDFNTPRGLRRVLLKEEEPKWNPPDWHYYSLAERVRQFPAEGLTLDDGRRVVRRGAWVGYQDPGGFTPIPQDSSLFFNGILYIPPFGTENRKVPGVLGHFKLDTGDGIMIHGTDDPLAIGFPATHGCIRVADEPLEELYREVDVGTPVYID
ncbi:MAG: L,D-transpeptidase [Gemmatimonadetes bacterium]|nr:L,D-transpeptidase [Gemmatimonadota bacterium]